MKRFILAVAVLLLVFSTAVPAFAGKRIEISPLAGTRLGGKLAVTGGNFTQLQLSNANNMGVAVALPVQPDLTLEFLYLRGSASLVGTQEFELPFTDTIEVVVTDIGDVDIDTFHLNLIYDFEGSIRNTTPFAFFGAGVTRFVPEKSLDLEDATRVSFAVGAGVRIFLHKHIGLRLQASWNPTLFSDDSELFFNDSANELYVLPTKTIMAQWDFSAGLVIRL